MPESELRQVGSWVVPGYDLFVHRDPAGDRGYPRGGGLV